MFDELVEGLLSNDFTLLPSLEAELLAQCFPEPEEERQALGTRLSVGIVQNQNTAFNDTDDVEMAAVEDSGMGTDDDEWLNSSGCSDDDEEEIAADSEVEADIELGLENLPEFTCPRVYSAARIAYVNCISKKIVSHVC